MLKGSKVNMVNTLDSNLNRVVQVYSLVCTPSSLRLYLYNLNYDLSPLSNEVNEGKDDISQTHVSQDLALQGDPALTHRVFNVPH